MNQWSTTIKPLGNGRYGARVLLNGNVLMEDNRAKTRQEAAVNLKDLLRWVDKLGYDCPMASASRDRRMRKYQRDV